MVVVRKLTGIMPAATIVIAASVSIANMLQTIDQTLTSSVRMARSKQRSQQPQNPTADPAAVGSYEHRQTRWGWLGETGSYRGFRLT